LFNFARVRTLRSSLSIEFLLCCVTELTAGAIAREVIEDVLDAMFPAEKAAADILAVLLDGVDMALRSRGIN
jgi:hypothetical protein